MHLLTPTFRESNVINLGNAVLDALAQERPGFPEGSQGAPAPVRSYGP